MSSAPALLDVSVPMYAAGRDHPCKEACVSVMTAVAEGRLVAAIDTEVGPYIDIRCLAVTTSR